MIAKKYRIDRNLMDFILKKGELITSKLFIIRYTNNREKFNRYRTIVSAKMDKKAVIRNRIKRRIYEAIRVISKELREQKNNLDIILIPKKRIIAAKYNEILNDIRKILSK